MLGTHRRERRERARLDLLRWRADVLQAKGDLVEDAREYDLILGILEQRRDGSRQLSRAVPPCVEAGELDPAREAPAVELRNEPREGAKQCRLAGAGAAEHQRDLSRGQTHGHVPKSRDGRARIREGKAFRARESHSTPPTTAS